MLVILLIDIIIGFAFSDSWFESVLLMVLLVIQVLVLNYEMKTLWEISNMTNPDSYPGFSLAFTLKIWHAMIVLDKKREATENLNSNKILKSPEKNGTFIKEHPS